MLLDNVLNDDTEGLWMKGAKYFTGSSEAVTSTAKVSWCIKVQPKDNLISLNYVKGGVEGRGGR